MSDKLFSPLPTVFDQFAAWAANPELVILGAHTTDFKGTVIALAACDLGGKRILDTRIQLSAGKIAPGAEMFHGIRDADLADAPPFPEVWAQVRPLLPRAVAFDPEFVARALALTLTYHAPPSPDASPATLEQYHEIAQFGARRDADVKNAYAYLGGVPNLRRGDSHPFEWRSLPDGLRERGIPDPLDRSALSQARRVALLIRACAALDPEADRFRHLRPPVTEVHDALREIVSEELPF